MPERNAKSLNSWGKCSYNLEGGKSTLWCSLCALNFPVVKNWLYLHKSYLLINRSTQTMVKMVSFCKVSPCVQARQSTSICNTKERRCFYYNTRKKNVRIHVKMEVKSFNFFLRVSIENQTHGCIPALPTDFSRSHAKRRWDGLFLFAGRVKFLNAAMAPKRLYWVGSGGDQEPESSAGKPGSKRSHGGNGVVVPTAHVHLSDLPCMVPRCACLIQGSVGGKNYF